MTESNYESRKGTSQSADVEEFVPDDAEALFDPETLPPTYSAMFVSDRAVYHTDVHCRRCYCDVARLDRETGTVTCPNCGWSSEDDEQTWRERADELNDRGDVPERQAEVVALVEQGKTHAEVKEQLELETRREVSTHVSRYRESRDETEWLAEYGPEV